MAFDVPPMAEKAIKQPSDNRARLFSCNPPRPTVLIASGNTDLLPAMAGAYNGLGYNVTVGPLNFDLEACQADILHFRWPEEITNWRRPTEKQADAISARLERWSRRSRVIVTVNNLYPHAYFRDPLYHRLYRAFYEKADVIHHYSETSKKLVCQEYPSASSKKHLVRLGFNYAHLLPAQEPDREELRKELGIQEDDVVFLVFGAIRFWEEPALVHRAFAGANVKRKKLLWAARLAWIPSWGERFRWLRMRARQLRRDVITITPYVPDHEVYKLLAIADVVVVARQGSLNSGLVPLAMTFGRMVVAPEVGAIPEFLAGSGNILYDPGSAESLKCALEQASRSDRERIGAENSRIAANWGWDEIIRDCVSALPQETRAGGILSAL